MRTKTSALCIAICSCAMPQPPTQVLYANATYWGESRMSVDLDTKVATLSTTRAEGPCLRGTPCPRPMMVTATRTLATEEVDSIRRLALAVLRDGKVEPENCPIVPEGQYTFEIVQSNESRFIGRGGMCMTQATSRLLRAMACGADPMNATKYPTSPKCSEGRAGF